MEGSFLAINVGPASIGLKRRVAVERAAALFRSIAATDARRVVGGRKQAGAEGEATGA